MLDPVESGVPNFKQSLANLDEVAQPFCDDAFQRNQPLGFVQCYFVCHKLVFGHSPSEQPDRLSDECGLWIISVTNPPHAVSGEELVGDTLGFIWN